MVQFVSHTMPLKTQIGGNEGGDFNFNQHLIKIINMMYGITLNSKSILIWNISKYFVDNIDCGQKKKMNKENEAE